MKMLSGAIFLISGLISPNIATQQNSIAYVTEVRGVVKVKKADKTEERITRTRLLREGETVKTGADGGGWVYQAYAEPEMLKPNASKIIRRLPPAVGPRLIDADKYLELEARVVAALQDTNRRSPHRAGGPDDLIMTALAPRKSLVLDGRPVFRWTPVGHAEKYKVALYRAKEDKPIWETTTTEPRAAYPSGRAGDSSNPLLPGGYKWEVMAIMDGEQRVYDAAEFIVARAWQSTAAGYALKIAGKAVKDKNANNLFYISACFDLQLYPEAEVELKRALRRTPDDLVLWALLMQAYEYMGRDEDRNNVIDYLEEPKASDLDHLLGNGTLHRQK